ncbi:GAF domain-containing protein [Alcanivorax xiamenensis]|uniref:GAF domain-containing protein n=1 Tax=Alcanivorax xiamenensis TaxID=1177156 RepID=UPI001358F254|nr:GAF domain-containing protein [Alcanivorax xiamenensis]
MGHQSVMQERVEAVRQALAVDVCSLYQAFPEAGELELVASGGLDPEALGARMTFSQGLTGKVARTGQPVVARQVADHPEYHHVANSGEERFKSYLGIPLSNGDRLIGVLVIQTVVAKSFFHNDIRELHRAGRDVREVLLARRARLE